MKKWITPEILLMGILLVGSLLRVWQLGNNPPELFADELVNIASAKSMIEQGHDLWGNRGWYFSDAVESRPPVYGYLAYITTRIVGLNVWGIRLPAVILGVITIYLTSRLTLLITGNTAASLWAAAVLALMPWHIHFSRVGWEPAALLCPFVGWIYATLLFCKHGRTKYLYVGTILAGTTLYTYQSAPLMVVCFGLLLVGTNLPIIRENWRNVIVAGSLFGLLSLPYLINLVNDPSLTERAQRIFTFREGINLTTLGIFGTNYLSNLGPRFLVVSGDPNWRHGAAMGIIGIVTYLMTGLGGYVIWGTKNIYRYLLLGWILLYPLSAALTNDGVPHATRTLLGIPVFAILAGTGITSFGVWLTKKYKRWVSGQMYVVLMAWVLLLSVFPFLARYFTDYPRLSQAWWEYGNGEALTTVSQLLKTNSYAGICLSNLTYWNQVPLIRYYLGEISTPIDIDSLESCLTEKSIIVIPSTMLLPNNLVIQKTVVDLEGKPIFTISTHY